ncbi:MAG TPA: hypothetical protein VNO52_15865 [Methylomirabilota bacterium]|nr:hypothetical protein [Methylomirabilota bacterium]
MDSGRRTPEDAGHQAGATAGQQHLLRLRAGQREFLRGVEKHRLAAFVARRQFGKTTTFAALAMKKMMKRPNHTVVFGSAKLNLSREIVRKEAEVLQRAIRALHPGGPPGASVLQVADAQTGRAPDQLTPDDFADLFEAQRLEFRLWHDRTTYSRTKVVALRPDTVGETGDLMCDEIGRIANWQEVWEAVEPIISSDPTFRLTLSTTPPPDDSHYSFAMLVPTVGTEFKVNPAGNWYRSEMGVMVLRLDAHDAWADGVPVYDLDKGEPLAPEEHRRRAWDKEAWDRNYGVRFLFGGTAAVSIPALSHAQAAGLGQCLCIRVDDDSDLEEAMRFLRQHLGVGPVSLGFDVATTEGDTSNPSALAVMERNGSEFPVRLMLVWKTADPARAELIVAETLDEIEQRADGGRARRLCIDATSERYFAQHIRKRFGGRVPVELVIASETIELPGEPEPVTMKAYLGADFAQHVEDGRVPLPPERYLKDDFRLVKRRKGSFEAELGPNGEHGDTFDAAKLALHGQKSTAGGILSAEGLRVGGNRTRFTTFRPTRLRA